LVVDPLQEIRPDGNRVLFDYDGQRNLNKMVLTDSTEQIELLSYTLQHKEDEITVLGSNGQEVHYTKGNFPFKLPHQLTQHFKRLAQVDGKHLIPTQYSYYKSTGGIAGKLESIQQPEGRQLRVEYYTDSRVHQLKAPIGRDDQLLQLQWSGARICELKIQIVCGDSGLGPLRCLSNRSHRQPGDPLFEIFAIYRHASELTA